MHFSRPRRSPAVDTAGGGALDCGCGTHVKGGRVLEARDYWIALSLVPEVGGARLAALCGHFGSAEAVLNASASALQQVPGIGPGLAGRISGWRGLVDVGGELAKAEAAGARILTSEDGEYPPVLRELPAPPPLLYVLGELPPPGSPAVAIVGARRASAYGIRTAHDLAGDLARRGLVIVSGMARGIDSAAHQGALDAGGLTVAVLGCGVDVVYPPENDKLYGRIVESGAVVSECPMGISPSAGNFPRRNRIISGLCLGVIVVEAGSDSGALITADLALEQGRDLLAVPGHAGDSKAVGPNALIKQGAALVETADDVLGALRLDHLSGVADAPSPRKVEFILSELGPDARAIHDVLSMDPMHIDEVTRAVGLSSPAVSSALLMLEMRKLVQQLPGKLFVRNA